MEVLSRSLLMKLLEYSIFEWFSMGLMNFFPLVYIFGLFNDIEMGYVTVDVSIMMVLSGNYSKIG